MEDKAPSIAAFAEVQKGFEKAVDLLQKEDEESKGKISSLVKKVEQESTKRNACELKLKEKENEADKLQQTIADMKISEKNKIQILKNELDKRRILIEELSDQNNSKDLNDLKAKADEKNKMIRSLKKRVKIFDEVLTKKQKEHEDFIKKEKEMQLMLRKKLKALKNGTQSVANDEKLKLVKKKYNEEVRLMRKEIEDYEARVQKMNSERFEWESEKQKCEEDLKVLLEDYAQKGELLTACQAKVEKFKERERKHHQNFDALKNLYERLEQKYKDTFNKERPEYVGMIRRVESLELENQRLRKSLSQSNNKYESLLLLDTTHQEVIEENVTLTSRIQNIEEWFDEAWAGFRLEVLNFEQKLELKNEIIRQLKGESEQTNKSTPFRKTESGVFCLQAMEELQHKFKLSKRPDWYIKAVKDLIFECSIQQNSKQNTDEVILPIEDVEKHKDDTSEPKVKSEEGVEQNMNKDYEDDFEEASHSENSSSTATSISEEVSGEQKPSTINSGCESCVSSASSGDSTKIVTTDDKTSPRSESFVEQTEADTSLSVVDEAGSPRDVIRSELPQYVAAQLQDDTSNGTNDIPKKFDHESKIDVKPPQKILAASENEIKQSVDDSLARLTPKKSSNLKRKISPLNGTKKSVSFDQKVDLQYFDEQNTPLTKNKEYVDILKAPNSETSKIFGSDNSKLKPAPVRKVYKNIPEYHPIKTIPQQLPKRNNSLPKLNKIPSKPLTGESKQEKITAADIFGPSSSKNTIEEESDALFDSNNLDDAMDFLLNM